MIRYLDVYRVELLLYTLVHNEEAIFRFDFRKFFPQWEFQIEFKPMETHGISTNQKANSI